VTKLPTVDQKHATIVNHGTGKIWSSMNDNGTVNITISSEDGKHSTGLDVAVEDFAIWLDRTSRMVQEHLLKPKGVQ
jgi:hypothetical protein